LAGLVGPTENPKWCDSALSGEEYGKSKKGLMTETKTVKHRWKKKKKREEEHIRTERGKRLTPDVIPSAKKRSQKASNHG